MIRAKRLTRALQAYDSALFCGQENGVLNVYRRTKTYEKYDLDGSVLLASKPFRHHVMALTHNWNVSGVPVDWGIEPILCRVKAMDLWNNDLHSAATLIKGYEKAKEIEEKDFRNNVESFLYDFRSQFAKATNDVNTSTLSKMDKRRIKDGYCK